MNSPRSLLAAVAVTLFLLSPNVSTADHLLGWNFDEASGPALDSGAAPDSDGSLIGGAARSSDTPGGFGSSIDLRDDANNWDYVVTSGDAQELDGLADLTLTTWLKLEEYTGGNSRLAAKQAGSPFDGFSWNLNSSVPSGTVSASNATMALFLGGADGFDFHVGDDASFDASEWTFLAATYASSTGDLIFYTGGVNTPVSQLSAGSAAAGVLNDNNSPFGVGFTDAAPTADVSAIGWQDDVRVYGRALSASELDSVRVSNIPEPTSLILAGVAGVCCLKLRRR